MRYVDDVIMFLGITLICGAPLWMTLFIILEEVKRRNP